MPRGCLRREGDKWGTSVSCELSGRAAKGTSQVNIINCKAHLGGGRGLVSPQSPPSRSDAGPRDANPPRTGGERSGFMARCPALFTGLGVAVEHVMTGSGPGYLSGEFNVPLESEGVRRAYTRSHSPGDTGSSSA